MTLKDKIFTALVTNRKQKTPAQLAAQLNTTKRSVAARISELRDDGYCIYTVKRTDTAGRTKTFYYHGVPDNSIVALGRLLIKAARQHAA
jgi:predicted ArsR family transcriptional regulator